MTFLRCLTSLKFLTSYDIFNIPDNSDILRFLSSMSCPNNMPDTCLTHHTVPDDRPAAAPPVQGDVDVLGLGQGGQLDQLHHGAVLADVQEGDLALVLALVRRLHRGSQEELVTYDCMMCAKLLKWGYVL